MKLLAVAILAILFSAPAWAGSAESIVEHCIAEAWQPHPVRVEWEFGGRAPGNLAQFDNWTLGDPRPTRIAGSVILTLQQSAQDGGIQRIRVSGTARVFGPSLTVGEPKCAGDPVVPSDLLPIEAEWTHLRGEPLTDTEHLGSALAVRALTPGRPVLTRDLKARPLVQRNQPVDLRYDDGSVRVRLAGRALCDGSVGEQVDVAVKLGKTRRFKGTVESDGTVRLTR